MEAVFLNFVPSAQDFKMVWPQISLVVFMLALLVVDLMDKRGETTTTGVFSIFAVIVTGVFTLGLWKEGPASIVFANMVIADNYSLFFNFIFFASFILTALISIRTLPREGYNYSEYYILMMGATFGMMLMASAADLIMVFIGIETLSISLYALAGFARQRKESNEAALKYLLLGAFATGFLLYGIALIYGATGTTYLYDIEKSAGMHTPLFMAGMLLMFVGLFFKASFVPFHMWSPDVYQGSPTPIAGFMSTAAKAAAFAVLFRILMVVFQDVKAISDLWWHDLLYVVAILTMTVGNVTAITQTNIKRMLAYSSVAHAGYLLIAILAWNKAGAGAIMFYLFSYTLMNVGAFGVIAAVRRGKKVNETLSGFAGLSKQYPILAAMMAIFMFALAGIPPTAGFFGKFLIFSSAVQAELYPLVIVGVANAVISVYFYLRVVVVMYMNEPEVENEKEPIGFFTGLALTLSVIGIFAIGIFPTPLLNMIENSFLYLIY